MQPTAPGKFFYIDPADPARKPRPVHIMITAGQLCAHFRDVDNPKAWTVVPVEDMAGEWTPA